MPRQYEIDDREWQSHHDARILTDALKIKADKKRLAKAKVAATKQVKEKAEEVKALKKIAKNVKPVKKTSKKTSVRPKIKTVKIKTIKRKK